MSAVQQLIEDEVRRDLDLNGLPKAVAPPLWCVYGSTAVLPGALFHKRRHAISYAESVTGFAWKKLRRMKYRCEKVELRPAK